MNQTKSTLVDMAYHINAKKNEIAKYVLIPGDPLRAKHIATTYLKNYKLVNTVRNMFMYTGTYKGVEITIASSGMGFSSMSIYAYELFKFYDVEVILRLGTCGSYVQDISAPDIINVNYAYGQPALAKDATNIDTNKMACDSTIQETINSVALEQNIKVFKRNIYSNLLFRFYDPMKWKEIVSKFDVAGTEMETFALLLYAKMFQRKGGCILTTVDSYLDSKNLDWKDREQHLAKMMVLGLETIVKYHQQQK